MYDHTKYRPFAPVNKTDRRWPSQRITQAPCWCSVDLRDGNQALIDPMTPEQKLAMFELLVDIGFREIEVGFPAASHTDFHFVRKLIEEDRIPENVRIQVLTQARKELIERSFDSLRGARKAIVHLYNSTSPTQRKKVFALAPSEIRQIAVNGATWIQVCADRQPGTDWMFQYSPESFTATELEFSVEICDAVTEIWQPTPAHPVIINLPATVEVATPNVYADQIEWVCDYIRNRDSLIISLHTHNDRGCAVAAAELGIMAGADRVEGTLLGNGERTGNMDIVTTAMNLYSQGIAPMLDLSNMDRIVSTVESCTRIQTHPRQPYVGEFVFTAFSGSHQDAIRKCMSVQADDDPWDVAYLPIDPGDLGRNYQEVIRINSQSGKGGVAWILEQEHQICMPRWMQIDFSSVVQKEAERTEVEVPPERIWALFQATYIHPGQAMQVREYQLERHQGQDRICATLEQDGVSEHFTGVGCGALDAFCNGLSDLWSLNISVVDYSEHTSGEGTEADALAYVQLGIQIAHGSQRVYGAARSADILSASLQSVLNALFSAELSAQDRESEKKRVA